MLVQGKRMICGLWICAVPAALFRKTGCHRGIYFLRQGAEKRAISEGRWIAAMREMRFKMERPGLVKPGDAVDVSEKKTALNYSYIINPAVAMSGCYKLPQRLKTLEGIVKDVEKTERGYYVIVEFDEEPLPEED